MYIHQHLQIVFFKFLFVLLNTTAKYSVCPLIASTVRKIFLKAERNLESCNTDFQKEDRTKSDPLPIRLIYFEYQM